MNNNFSTDEETELTTHITELIRGGAGIVTQKLDSIEL